MKVVRLMERNYADPDTGEAVRDMVVLEASPEGLARARALGGEVFDVECDGTSGLSSFRREAEQVLELSRQSADVRTDPVRFGLIAQAKLRVTRVEA